MPVTYERRSLGKKCTLSSNPAGLSGNYPEILLKYVDIEVGRVVFGCPGMLACRRVEHGDGVVACGYPGMLACRRVEHGDGVVAPGRPDVLAFRRAEHGDGVVAFGYGGMLACRRASPTAEAMG